MGVPEKSDMVSRVMNKGQSNVFTQEVRTIHDLDVVTAMVAGIQTQQEDPRSPIRTPSSTFLIHDTSGVSIPGVSEHSEDFKSSCYECGLCG